MAAVVVFHAFPGLLEGGFIGVDVFFVISGYLISRIILTDLGRGTFSFGAFYARRIRRILPALVLVMAASLVFGWFVLFSDEFRQLGKHIGAGAAFLSNVALWREAGYFDVSAETKPLLHLWSLAIEEQFYVAWPVILWSISKWRVSPAWTAALIFAASLGLCLVSTQQDAVAAFFSPFTRCWELMCGALIATTGARKTPVSTLPTQTASDGGAISNLLSVSGLILLIGSFVTIDKDADFPGLWALMPVTATALIVYAGPGAWFNQKILSARIFVCAGLISFPLYLWHWPLLSFARILEGSTPDATMRVAIVASSVLLAWVTYRNVEKPIRTGPQAGAKTGMLAIALIVVGLLGCGAYFTDGWERRSFVRAHGDQRALESSLESPVTPDCLALVPATALSYCRRSARSEPTVALIGDSHANAMFEFFRAYFEAQGKGVILLGKGGCPPLLGVERGTEGCEAATSGIVRYLNASPQIADVFLAGRFAATQSGIDFGGSATGNYYPLRLVDEIPGADRDAVFVAGLSRTVAELTGAGKSVTVVLDVPELDFDPRSCLRRSRRGNCFMNRAIVEARQFAYRKLVERVRERHPFRTVDMMETFCDASVCMAAEGGEILYRDSHHLGARGNEYLARKGFRLN